MIPGFDDDGNLPAGIHTATWGEIVSRFGTTPYRRGLLNGLRTGIEMLANAGCQMVYLDGSFVSSKPIPGDFDACWESDGVDPNLLDPVILNFANGRAAQKAKYRGEFFIAGIQEQGSGKLFVEFFQVDKNTGKPKGVVAIDLRRLNS